MRKPGANTEITINVDELSATIISELLNYSEEIDNEMKTVILDLGKEILQELKNDPIIPTMRPKYKKSFYIKKIAEGRGYKKITIANREYRLTHLLENGHLTRNGITSTTTFPHWVHAQEKAETLPKRLEEIIQNDNK